MVVDSAEDADAMRRSLVEVINSVSDEVFLDFVHEHDVDTYDTQELTAQFEVLGFAAPLVVVRRKSDGVLGSLYFRHSPRVYFGFSED